MEKLEASPALPSNETKALNRYPIIAQYTNRPDAVPWEVVFWWLQRRVRGFQAVPNYNQVYEYTSCSSMGCGFSIFAKGSASDKRITPCCNKCTLAFKSVDQRKKYATRCSKIAPWRHAMLSPTNRPKSSVTNRRSFRSWCYKWVKTIAIALMDFSARHRVSASNSRMDGSENSYTNNSR